MKLKVSLAAIAAMMLVLGCNTTPKTAAEKDQLHTDAQSTLTKMESQDPGIRDLLSVNFRQWVDAIEACLAAAGDRLPATLDRRSLAEFTLTVMEGAIMQARTYREIASFDRNIAVLRAHFDMLIETARQENVPARAFDEGGKDA